MINAGPIVIPLDGSPNAEKALPAALLLARATGAPLHFVHVVDDERASGDEALARARDLFASHVDELLQARGAFDLAHSTDVITGNPARAVLDCAAGASFITLATHGRGGLRATFLGSVADKIVRGTRVPVIAVPLDAPVTVPGSPIVVGLDGSEVAEAGLTMARELGAQLGSRLVLVRTYTIPTPGVDFVAYPVDLPTALREGSEEYLRQTARDNEGTVSRLGGAADAIVETAEQVDAGLVVLTSQGKGLTGRLALGSTTDRVLHSLKRPLLVVPAAAQA